LRDLLRLMEDRKFWAKLSGSERASRQAAPWKDAIPFARKLHPNLKEVPDDGLMADLIGE
jgi:2-pyrone-4,6-dicarboxylate lactonase